MELYDFFTSQELYITNQSGADIQVKEPVRLLLTKDSLKDNWKLHILDGDVIVNYFYPEEKEIELVEGSILQLGQTTLELFNDELHVLEGQIETALTKIKKSAHGLPKDYPDYHRSPRLIKREPKGEITIDNPPEKIQKNSQGLFRTILPPLVMIAASILMFLFNASGIFMLMTLATTSVTVIFSIYDYFKNKKNYKHDVEKRKEKYTEYIEEKEKQIYQVQQQQHDNAFYNYPSPSQIFNMVGYYDSRIYEKRSVDFDFLKYRLGLGTVQTSAQVKGGDGSSIDLDDPLMERAYNLVNSKQELKNMPITTDLMHQPVGYVGPKELVIEQLQWMLCQLATFQSYHDVRFIAVFNEKDYDKWSWLRWFKQFYLPELKMNGFVFDAKSRDVIMNYLNQVLKERQNEIKIEKIGSDKKINFMPHYVLVVEDEQLILDHAIMEILGAKPEKLGLSLVYVKDVMSSLPENVKTVIDIRDRHTGELVMEQGKLIQKQFKLDHLNNENKELMPRQLASLNHLETLKSSVPEKLTFMQMYGVKTVEDLNITQRWNEHSPYKTLAVPLGVSGPDEIVDLNLHERAHGPHGLIAGTTGSGKSELIQSYILSLAVNFHPYDVAFLLIDYKGGGMANLFKDLPHLVGTITNLDKAQSMRALESINAELKKRQRLFAKYNVNHINAYQKLFKEGKAEEPMPHLFMISDEFAELKSEQPDFMDELISTARIGRSLGVHLILATQKPAGVVNDQIWSNSNFKISLKVSDKEDSMEVLKTPDAASITLPGRAYLEVGNNEMYELFQSAYSGADYRPDEDDSKQSFLIKKIDKLGQQHVISQDLSGLDETGHVEKVPTQLEAVVNKVHQLFEESGDQPLAQPWLPPLRERIFVSELRKLQNKERELCAVIGQVDIPSQQSQEPISINLSEEGNAAVYASGGYGKSTFLQTLIMELVRTHTPDELNIYLIDFGTNGLLPLRNLPHVADTITLGETEKLYKFMRIIQRIIDERKRLLDKYAVANIKMYQEETGNVIPEIVIVLDNIDGQRDTAFEDDFNNILSKITRDGSSIGLHLVLSAAMPSSIYNTLANNIKLKISLYQNNPDNLMDIVGNTKIQVDDLPGRGIIIKDEPRLFQTALPVDGESDLDVIRNLRKEVDQINENWDGACPTPIPMIPSELKINDYLANNQVIQEINSNILPIGLDFEEVKPLGINIEKIQQLLVISDNPESQANVIRHLLDTVQMFANLGTMLLDTDSEWETYKDKVNTYVNGDMLLSFQEMLNQEIDRRLDQDDISTPWMIVIPDMMNFVKVTNIMSNDLEEIFNNARKANIHFIIGSSDGYLKQYDDVPQLISQNLTDVVFSMRPQDQTFVDEGRVNDNKYLEIDEAYLYKNRMFTKIKLTK